MIDFFQQTRIPLSVAMSSVAEMEIESLEAIFTDDLKVIEVAKQIQLNIVPFPGEENDGSFHFQ